MQKLPISGLDLLLKDYDLNHANLQNFFSAIFSKKEWKGRFNWMDLYNFEVTGILPCLRFFCRFFNTISKLILQKVFNSKPQRLKIKANRKHSFPFEGMVETVQKKLSHIQQPRVPVLRIYGLCLLTQNMNSYYSVKRENRLWLDKGEKTQKSQSFVLCVPFQAQQNALTATAVGKCTTLFLCQDWHRNFLRMEFDIAGCYISFAYAEW